MSQLSILHKKSEELAGLTPQTNRQTNKYNVKLCKETMKDQNIQLLFYIKVLGIYVETNLYYSIYSCSGDIFSHCFGSQEGYKETYDAET